MQFWPYRIFHSRIFSRPVSTTCVASRPLHGAVLWRVAFLSRSVRVYTQLQGIQYALSWHPLMTGARWLMLYDRQQLDRDESCTRWLIGMTHHSAVTRRTVCQFDDKIRHNYLPQFAEILVLQRSNLMSVKRALVLSVESVLGLQVYVSALLLLLQRIGNTLQTVQNNFILHALQVHLIAVSLNIMRGGSRRG